MRRRGFGRPLLGAAVVVGASRSAARREVARQTQMTAEAQRQAEATYQRQQQEEAAREQKVQDQIQAALAEERSRSKSPMPPAQFNEQLAPTRGGNVIGFCSSCGNQRLASDKFCSGCGKIHPPMDNAGSPPQYLDAGSRTADPKDLKNMV